MIWSLERGESRITCEIRRPADSGVYEFELAAAGTAPEKHQFDSPTELIDEYLRRQSALRAEGWRPHVTEVPMFS